MIDGSVSTSTPSIVTVTRCGVARRASVWIERARWSLWTLRRPRANRDWPVFSEAICGFYTFMSVKYISRSAGVVVTRMDKLA
jgi:hypothetical protein